MLAGFSPEADDWGFALEQDIEIEDISSVPEPSWYTEAMQQAEHDLAREMDEELPLVFDFEEEVPTSPAIVDVEVSTSAGETLPDWLQDLEPTIEEDPSLPDWLRAEDEIGGWLVDQQSSRDEETRDVPAPIFADTSAPSRQEPSIPAIGLPSDERLAQAREGGYPSWYIPPSPVTEPAPAVQQQVPPPKPEPKPVVQQQAPPKPAPQTEPTPEPAAVIPSDLADYVQRLERNPNDHSSRLTFARHLSRANQINESLNEYETLIKKSAELDNVSSELANLIKQLPTHPKARRLLGDVYMRQGRLQEALDTYRGALDKI